MGLQFHFLSSQQLINFHFNRHFYSEITNLTFRFWVRASEWVHKPIT